MEDIWLKLADEVKKEEEIPSMTLIHVDLAQAYDTFVSYVAKQDTDPIVLEEIHQEKLARLDQYMDMLTRLASAGMEEQLSPLLSTLLQEWAIKEVVELLLRYPGCAFDPADPGLQQTFWRKLGRQHQALSSELLLHLQQARVARAQAEAERAQSWQTVAARSVEDQRQQNLQFQGAAIQWVQHEQQMFSQHQQANREWADVAIVGVQQAQLGVKQWYDFASSTQQSVANMLVGTEQRQAAVVEQAVHKSNMKKWGSRLMIIGLVIVGILAMFGCAFFGLMHLY